MHKRMEGAEVLSIFIYKTKTKRMIDKEALKATLEKGMEGTDLFLVDVEIDKDNRITVEIDSDSSVDIDECIRLNRLVEENFDRDVEDYELEIGSAGLTSPLKLPRQYAKNIGNEVEVLTNDGKKLKGELVKSDDNGFAISVSKKVKPEGAKRPIMVQEELTLRYDEIKYTKYIIQF